MTDPAARHTDPTGACVRDRDDVQRHIEGIRRALQRDPRALDLLSNIVGLMAVLIRERKAS